MMRISPRDIEGYAICAGVAAKQRLIEQLIRLDPHQDPDHLGDLVVYLRKGDLSSPIIERLSALLKDDTLSWWLRRKAAISLYMNPVAADITTLVGTMQADVDWISEADSVLDLPNFPDRIDRLLAQAKADDERQALTIIKVLGTAFAANGQDHDYCQRMGAIQVACVSRWAAEHPDTALLPACVELMLSGFLENNSPNGDERVQGERYVTSIIQRGFFKEATFANMRYPEDGPLSMRSLAFQTMEWAVHTDNHVWDAEHDGLVDECAEAVRRLRKTAAPPSLLLYADRKLAEAIRYHMREYHGDPAIFRDLLVGCDFAVVPVDTFLLSLEPLAHSTVR
jgi:hypothetical protein